MCLICLEWQKNKMNAKEALRALGELMSSGNDKENAHYLEVSSKILDKEVPLKDGDAELDGLWEDNKKE